MMARPSSTPDPFQSAVMVLRSAVAERRGKRLTPTVPPPRDSDATIGDPLPEHGAAPSSDDGRGRDALPPPPSAWAWADADSDDGGTRR